MKRLQNSLLCLLLVVICLPAQAIISDELIMVRSAKSFDDAMTILQASIKDQGYTVSRVQQVDAGLTRSGYKTDKYRVVLFGKAEEITALKKTPPELIPYLPLKISIFCRSQ